ncbi:hypothetical protein H920_06008 [Fukomys damarensis]|uniref:Uncharacterized protein n=1 Tax=Fukomys damarensis TaxID=885580 RepID=A0A091DNC5_FUKDA|nr:hypothetical protein H920_06008 [Fukomys damarensis]
MLPFRRFKYRVLPAAPGFRLCRGQNDFATPVCNGGSTREQRRARPRVERKLRARLAEVQSETHAWSPGSSALRGKAFHPHNPPPRTHRVIPRTCLARPRTTPVSPHTGPVGRERERKRSDRVRSLAKAEDLQPACCTL